MITFRLYSSCVTTIIRAHQVLSVVKTCHVDYDNTNRGTERSWPVAEILFCMLELERWKKQIFVAIKYPRYALFDSRNQYRREDVTVKVQQSKWATYPIVLGLKI